MMYQKPGKTRIHNPMCRKDRKNQARPITGSRPLGEIATGAGTP
jgi:hypothetical protein